MVAMDVIMEDNLHILEQWSIAIKLCIFNFFWLRHQRSYLLKQTLLFCWVYKKFIHNLFWYLRECNTSIIASMVCSSSNKVFRAIYIWVSRFIEFSLKNPISTSIIPRNVIRKRRISLFCLIMYSNLSQFISI